MQNQSKIEGKRIMDKIQEKQSCKRNELYVRADRGGMSDVNTKWLMLFDKHYPKFKWFIEGYFGLNKCVFIEELRKDNNIDVLHTELGMIWFHLPDGQFNIMVMPKGWSEFLELLETEIEGVA